MLLLDAHVHVYPFYDQAVLLSGAVERLGAIAGKDDAIGIVLVEREGVDVFGEWAAGRLPEGWSATRLDDRSMRLESASGRGLHVFAGRQIACAARLEILGVGTRVAVKDGVRCEEAIEAVAADGGLPVLAWGVGKWLLGRAGTVRELLLRHAPDTLALCDTSLRPVFWPKPAAMRGGVRPVLCGSDPLPRKGEEAQAGRYACEVAMELPVSEPTKRLILQLRAGGLVPRGRRSSAVEFLRRH